jgi:hypothetical protein
MQHAEVIGTVYKNINIVEQFRTHLILKCIVLDQGLSRFTAQLRGLARVQPPEL